MANQFLKLRASNESQQDREILPPISPHDPIIEIDHISKNFQEKEFKLENIKIGLIRKYQEFQYKLNKIGKVKAKLERNENFLELKLQSLQEFSEWNRVKKEKTRIKIKQVKKSSKRLHKELRIILNETNILHKRETQIKDHIAKMMSHKAFIEKAIALLPRDYVKTSKDQSIEGLMSRFKSLFHINEVLFMSIEGKSSQLKILQYQQSDLKGILDMGTINAIAQIKNIYIWKDSVKDKLDESQIDYYNEYIETREKVKTFGKILVSLNNITNKCISVYKLFGIEDSSFIQSNLLKTMPWSEKISKINEYIHNNLDLIAAINELNEISPYFLTILKRRFDLRRKSR